jgi:hypothetical protein
MSHIPNNAMPHAGHIETAEDQDEGTAATLTRKANGIADKVKANPKPAIAAGAAILAGAVAAAAIPFIGRNWKSDDKKTSAKKSGGAKVKKTTKA